MDMSMWSAYFITAVWDHCVLLGLSLHGAAEQCIIFCTGICFPHCPCRNCHLWRLPKFYIFGQLLLKNKKNKTNQTGIYITSKTSQVQQVPLLGLKAAQTYSGPLLTLDKKKNTSWGSHCCNMVGRHSFFFLPMRWLKWRIYCMILILDDQFKCLTMLPTFENLLWVFKHSTFLLKSMF